MTLHRTSILTLLTVALSGNALGASLQELLDEAMRNNPDIAAALRGWQASAQVPTQVSTLPDPLVSVQHVSVGSPRPFAGYTNNDFALIGLGISQDIPYPGKLRLKAQAADRDVAMTRDKYESAKRSIAEQVKASYFQIAYLSKTLDVLIRDQTLLDQIEFVAAARYRLGQGNQQELLKVQLQKTKLLQDIAQHHGLMSSQQAQMKRLLNRVPGTPEVDAEDLIETPVLYSPDELMAKVRTHNPDVTGEQEMVRKQSLQVEIARKDRYPDFSVQYMWSHRADPFPDYYSLTVSARLPIYRKKKLDPELTQATEELNQSRREYESRVQQAYFDVRDQLVSVETASQTLKIYREGLIPQALATFRAGLTSYQTGSQDFQTLLSAYLDVLNFDLEYWKMLADHETAVARIEQLTGVKVY